MPQIHTIPEIILIAEVSQPLAQIDIEARGLYGGGTDLNLPQKIYSVRKNVERMYDLLPLESSLFSTANYLYALCGKYALLAEILIGRGGGGQIVNPSGLGTSIAAIFIQFIVGVSEMNAGDTVYTVVYNNIINGSISVELDGSELPVNISGQISYTIIYSSTNAIITFNQPVFNGQLFIIRGLRFTI